MTQTNLNLSSNQQERIRNIVGLQLGINMIGVIGGILYAKRTGGGFGRYLGYSLLGSLIVGIPAALIATPFKNKILKEGESNVPVNTKNVSSSTESKATNLKDIEKTISSKTTFQKK
jgi:hypothetical protein